MSYNQNGVPSPSKTSHHIQILGSDPEQHHLLAYCATEDEWTTYLNNSAFNNPNVTTRQPSIPSHTLKATVGGPTQMNSNSTDQKDNSNTKKYAIISIMGPQSSGKSTLLNKLFGTQFAVMDHTRGRHQVTTGIWIGNCPKASNLMVLDLEGTDSAERKQNRSNFERQTSLMALTLSEVLIINMWASDIGRQAGMNVDTLRAILEANLRLFAPNSKTLLLFIIREQSSDETAFGVTPAAQLRRNIEKVLQNIWNEIDKPDSFGNKQISDLFDIDYYFMPPLIYFTKQFNEAIIDLYNRFTNPNDNNYYFNTSYHYSKCVPPEGLFTWTKQIFDAITSDESLNIPDQQKLLSAYRCEHALNESFEIFTKGIEPMNKEVKEKYIDGFGAKLDKIIEKCVFEYKQTANKYDKEEAAEKYKSLVDKIETQVQFLFNFQYKHLIEKVKELYYFEMNQSLPKGQCVSNLEEIVNRVGQNVRKFFSNKIEECMIKTENKTFLNKDMYWQETSKRLREASKAIQAEQWQYLCKENEYLADEHLLSQIGRLLRKPTQRIWHQISSLRIEYHAKILNVSILSKLKNLMYDELKLNEKIKTIRDSSDTLIINRCKKYCSRMDGVLQDRFDQLFNKNPDTGIPRTWDENIKLDEIFTNAKQQCLEILKLTQNIILEENLDLNLQEIKLKLLSADTCDDIRTDFLRYADNEYRRAQDNIRRSKFIGGGILPSHPVTWLIFLFFAKDEIWSMLTNPLYLITFIFGAAIVTIGYQAHVYGFDVQTIITQMIQKVVNFVLHKLEEFQRAQQDIQSRGKGRTQRGRTRNLMDDDNGNENGNNNNNGGKFNSTTAMK